MPSQSPDNGKTKITLADDLYKVENKSLNPPTRVPAGYPEKGKTIKWVAKFGFKPLNPNSVPAAQLENGFMKGDIREYEVRIEKAGDKLWCFDGKDISPLSYSVENKTTAVVKLKKGDPALGWT